MGSSNESVYRAFKDNFPRYDCAVKNPEPTIPLPDSAAVEPPDDPISSAIRARSKTTSKAESCISITRQKRNDDRYLASNLCDRTVALAYCGVLSNCDQGYDNTHFFVVPANGVLEVYEPKYPDFVAACFGSSSMIKIRNRFSYECLDAKRFHLEKQSNAPEPLRKQLVDCYTGKTECEFTENQELATVKPRPFTFNCPDGKLVSGRLTVKLGSRNQFLIIELVNKSRSILNVSGSRIVSDAEIVSLVVSSCYDIDDNDKGTLTQFFLRNPKNTDISPDYIERTRSSVLGVRG